MADALASLIVAASDLAVVRLIRGAMAAADCGGCGRLEGPLGTIRCDRFEPRPHVHPTPRFEPRPVFHPTPRFTPRPVIHPVSKFEPQDRPAAFDPGKPYHIKPVFPPPWKTLPIKTPAQPALKIKVVQVRPDIVHKGSLLDFYI